MTWADEHVIGVAKGVDPEVLEGLRAHFSGECSEVGMYLAMSRQADREGYPEIAEAFKRYAWEEAEHAAKFAELLGEIVWDTKTNVKARMEAECGACEDKKRIATLAKKLNLDAIHDTVHEMCKDESASRQRFRGSLQSLLQEIVELSAGVACRRAIVEREALRGLPSFFFECFVIGNTNGRARECRYVRATRNA